MNFQALLAQSAKTSAAVFSRNAAGEIPRAWFPANAAVRACALADYTVDAGQVTEGPVKASVAAALGLHLSERNSKSLLMGALAWMPDKGTTTLIVGFPISGTSNPDPARVKRYRIADFQSLAGVWEITAEEIAGLESP